MPGPVDRADDRSAFQSRLSARHSRISEHQLRYRHSSYRKVPAPRGAMIDIPTVSSRLTSGSRVLEALPGRPITGERAGATGRHDHARVLRGLARPRLTPEQVKVRLILHLRNYLDDTALGLISTADVGDIEPHADQPHGSAPAPAPPGVPDPGKLVPPLCRRYRRAAVHSTRFRSLARRHRTRGRRGSHRFRDSLAVRFSPYRYTQVNKCGSPRRGSSRFATTRRRTPARPKPRRSAADEPAAARQGRMPSLNPHPPRNPTIFVDVANYNHTSITFSEASGPPGECRGREDRPCWMQSRSRPV